MIVDIISMRLIIIIAVITVLAAGLTATGKRVNLKALSEPPTDSAEAERVRIWVPIEGSTKCRTGIVVLDESGKAVRHVLNELLPMGYHNFYWDKRDDSGTYVPPGNYRYKAIICNRTQDGKLSAVYLPGERESSVKLLDCIKAAHFEFEVNTDSAVVGAAIENARGRRLSTLFQDSVLYRGRHLLEWTPEYGYAGLFTLVLTVDKYSHRLEFRHSGIKRPRK